VQTFCEQAAVPCLFPNVDLPPKDTEPAFHSIYFSRGVLLEADLISREVAKLKDAPGFKQIRQVYRREDIGEAAAAALAQTLQASGIRVSNWAIPASAPTTAVRAALRDLPAHGALILWLRPRDLAAVQGSGGARIYLSGLMGEVDENPLPPIWRGRAHVAYPFDLPESRRVRVDYVFGWFRIRNIAIVAALVQANTYLACGLVSETLKHMVDTFVPDYLIERLEDTTEHRILTGYYPRLTLGSHQRFASKGGYVVHPDEIGPRLIPDGDWMAP
jgi:hypothetical protein